LILNQYKKSLHLQKQVQAFCCKYKPPAVLVVPKSFSFVHIIYPSKARSQVAFPHWGRQI